jgi:hypothetical protein
MADPYAALGGKDLDEDDDYAALGMAEPEFRQDWGDAGARATPTDRLRAAAATLSAKDPGFLRSLVSSGYQGAYKGGSDEVAGAITRGRVSPGEGAAWRQPDGSTVPLNTGWDVYRAGRNSEREVLRGAREHWPKTSFAAEVGGDLLSDFLLSRAGLPGVPAWRGRRSLQRGNRGPHGAAGQ